MSYRSAIWRKIVQQDNYQMQTVLRVGNTIYSEITAPVIERVLMDKPLSVGNCAAASMRVSVLTDTEIPQSSPIVVSGRLTDGTLYSEWYELGTFFVDTRVKEHNGLITLECYDSMLRANTEYDSRFDTAWPKPMLTMVEIIANQMGVGIDPLTRINTGVNYQIPKPDGLTMNQILGYIAGCHGGNWVITGENLLRLVPLSTLPTASYCITDSVGNHIETSNGGALIYYRRTERTTALPAVTGETPDSATPIMYGVLDAAQRQITDVNDDRIVWHDNTEIASKTVNVAAVLGKFTVSDTMIVSGVVMTDQNGTQFSAGSDNGAVITIPENPYANQPICDALYAAYSGLLYVAFEATESVCDPSVDLGDGVEIGSTLGVAYGIKLALGVLPTADIRAPKDETLESEYPYKSVNDTKFERLKAAVDGAVAQMEHFGGGIGQFERRLIDLEKQTESYSAIGALPLADIAAIFN